LTLPNEVVAISESRVLVESTIKEPLLVKFTISLLPIEEVAIFDESMMVVADEAGLVRSCANNKVNEKRRNENVVFKIIFFKVM